MKFLHLALLLLTACAIRVERTLPIPPGCDSWGKLPLTVALDESAVDYRGDVDRGMRAWNSAMGRIAFVWTDADPDVVVVVGPTHRARERGFTSTECHDGSVASIVLLQPGLDAGAVTPWASHELGHALGLGHSTNEQSIMHATIDVSLMGPWDDDHAPKSYRILPTDARLAAALHADYAAATESGPELEDDGISTSPSDPWTAFGDGNYALGVTLLLMAALALLRKVFPSLFASDLARAATAFLGSFLGALSTTWTHAFSWSGVRAAFTVAVLAMGGYSVLWKKLVKPLLFKLASKLGWLEMAKLTAPSDSVAQSLRLDGGVIIAADGK